MGFCAKGRSKVEACRRRLGMFAVVPCGDRMRESIGVSLPGYSGSRHSTVFCGITLRPKRRIILRQHRKQDEHV